MSQIFDLDFAPNEVGVIARQVGLERLTQRLRLGVIAIEDHADQLAPWPQFA